MKIKFSLKKTNYQEQVKKFFQGMHVVFEEKKNLIVERIRHYTQHKLSVEHNQTEHSM